MLKHVSNILSLNIQGVGENICDNSLTRESFNNFIDNLFKNSSIDLREYQKDAAFNCLYYRQSCIEVSTSGGKTIIAYIIFKYLREVCGIKHFLFITPSTALTTQSKDKFLLYDKLAGIETDWSWLEIYSGAKKKRMRNMMKISYLAIISHCVIKNRSSFRNLK